MRSTPRDPETGFSHHCQQRKPDMSGHPKWKTSMVRAFRHRSLPAGQSFKPTITSDILGYQITRKEAVAK
jgi:hypothetical protein